MPKGGPVGHNFDWPKYQVTAEGLRSLGSQLPGDIVRRLAEEVIARTTRLAAGHPYDFALVQEKIEEIARALISAEPDAALKIIEDMRLQGTSIEDIYLVYLAASARTLGEWWDTDKVTFGQVTIGTSRIYGILRALDDVRKEPVRRSLSRSAVFANVPGETHTLGLRMAADLLRQRGWEIQLLLDLDHDELIEQIEKTSHVIIGLTAGGDHVIASLARLILAIRIHRPDVRILVSGNAVEQCQDLVAAMSPDGVAPDFESAAQVLDRLWSQTQ